MLNKKELYSALKSMVIQFAYRDDEDGLTTRGLSALEDAFHALGWNDPHPCSERTCQVLGCFVHCSGGIADRNGNYFHCCNEHHKGISEGGFFVKKQERNYIKLKEMENDKA